MQFITKCMLIFLRSLLTVSLVAVIMLSGARADTGRITGEAATASIETAIEFNNGKLSVSLDGIPLRQVIKELSRQTGIDIQIVGKHPAYTVNMRFIDSPADKGLRLLFQDVNTIFVYADADDSGVHGRQPDKVFVLPKGENNNVHIGMVKVIETLSRITPQIEDSIPQSQINANINPQMIETVTEQAISELSETLANRIINASRTPN